MRVRVFLTSRPTRFLARWPAAVLAVEAARCACVLAVRALRLAVLRLRVVAEALPRALRCVAVVLLRRRVLLLRRPLLVVVLLVDIRCLLRNSCLLGILLELIPSPLTNKPGPSAGYVTSRTYRCSPGRRGRDADGSSRSD